MNQLLSYDPRNVVDLLDKNRDGNIVDSGWREVDSHEWVNYLDFETNLLSKL